MCSHGVGRQAFDDVHRVVEERDVVAGVDAGAEILAAVLLEQRAHFFGGPVLVVLKTERHPILLEDGERPRDLAF